ncbi:hypothetical protein GRI40_08435 [Altererythrobacter aerius]|uniref:Uncharacterized protein n=1 Tax=Tsuneonella aeria TaxID=1837929 RepID=A0A6I4TD56_9SPHN|nr:hypothetical protein [Tsuneonella aeria]MXO75241.1 hypothetical protein [Tsuneonella aeria]
MTRSLRRTTAAASLATLALALGGCQALGIGGNRMASAPAADGEIAAPFDFGAEQLAEGREALRKGHIPVAIDSFMLAKSFQEHAPAAYNGLAVAYSRLGREDLAERFFLTAVALSPEDSRYRSNLALFYVRSGIPRVGQAALAAAAPAATPAPAPAPDVLVAETTVVSPVVRQLAGGISVQAPPRRIQRVSAAEVTIRAAEPGAPALATNQRRAVIEVGARSARPAVRTVTVASVRPAARVQTYPIRIPLGE